MPTEKVSEAAAVNTNVEKDPLIGKQLGDYRLTSVLATGGMARIYKGMDYKLQRPAAVKVLAQEDSEADKTLMKRFQREARAVAALEHDNIITIYQYGEQEGVYFLAMKLVKGKDLAQELKRLKKAGQRMEISRALRILEQVASALDVAHAASVVHRDIKPSNILIDESDKAVLTDFGLVLRPSVETTMGTAFGTPRYIAPEQAISSNQAVPQSDIYALGIILYEILCGETPFTGDSPMEIALSQISDAPPAPRTRNKDIPASVEREILKALDKDPEKRHKTATELIKAVKGGYGIESASSVVPTPVKMDSTHPTDSWTLSEASASVSLARNKLARSKTDPTRPLLMGQSRSRLVYALVAVLIVVGIGIFIATRGTGSGAALGAPVTLMYDDANFTMLNGGDYTFNVQNLQFRRGIDDNVDDYAGDRISRDILPAGSCARVQLQGRQNNAPPQCSAIQSAEFLADQTKLFWRKETADGSTATTFEVWFEGNMIQRCDTVARGGDAECRFNWPVPAPTPVPSA